MYALINKCFKRKKYPQCYCEWVREGVGAIFSETTRFLDIVTKYLNIYLGFHSPDISYWFSCVYKIWKLLSGVNQCTLEEYCFLFRLSYKLQCAELAALSKRHLSRVRTAWKQASGIHNPGWYIRDVTDV